MRAQQIVNGIVAAMTADIRDRLTAAGFPTHSLHIDIGGTVDAASGARYTVGARRSWTETPDEAARRRSIAHRRETQC